MADVPQCPLPRCEGLHGPDAVFRCFRPLASFARPHQVRDSAASNACPGVYLGSSQQENWIMNPTLFEIGVTTIMLAVIVALIVWFSRYLAVVSGRRMMQMMMRAGGDPEVARQGGAKAITQDVRSCARGTGFAASPMRRFRASFFSSCPSLVVTSPSTTNLPFGRKRRGRK